MSELKLLEEKLNLAMQRAERFRAARDTAERLLEQKSTELYESNLALQTSRDNLAKDVAYATKELQESNDLLTTALEEKSTFIGSLSHEVRTPLNAVIGLSELLLDMQMDEKQKEYVETIFASANSLMKLVNAVLDISKIESGKIELSPSPVNVRISLESLVKMYTLDAERLGSTLAVNISESVPDYLELDEGRYVQIITNLVSNAIKNTPEGQITISLDYQDGVLKSRVADNGCGIEKEKISKIFEAYEQLGNPDQGVGLGLAICKHLTTLMNGKITCESELGSGSVFSIDIPLAATSAPESVSSQDDLYEHFTQLKVLIAEDNPVNQTVLKAQFSQFSVLPNIVDNGQEALDELMRNDDYDVVFLDIQMPVLDGEQTLLKIRSSDQIRDDLYCIALTAAGYYNRREQLLALGFNGFLAKPLMLSQLQEALSTIVAMETADKSEIVDMNQPSGDSRSSFDFTFLESQFGDAAQTIFAQLAPIFLEHSYSELTDLENAIQANQRAQIKKIAHSIKGASLSMGLTVISELFARMEAEPEIANDVFPDAKTQMLTVKAQINNHLAGKA